MVLIESGSREGRVAPGVAEMSKGLTGGVQEAKQAPGAADSEMGSRVRCRRAKMHWVHVE